MSIIQLPTIFQDHMMLQRDKKIVIWGSASENVHFTIKLGAFSISSKVQNSKFYCGLPSMKACREQTLSIFIEDSKIPDVEIAHISIGDVWIAAGQSNMEFFLRYDAHWDSTKRLDKNENIRMYNCPRVAFPGQEDDPKSSGFWFEEHDLAWETFSAPGYSFARELQPRLNVPVGIIGCNWGGTPICAWLDESYMQEPPNNIFLEEYAKALEGVDLEQLRAESMEALAYEKTYQYQMALRVLMYGLNEQDQEEWMRQYAHSPMVPMGSYHHCRPAGLYHEMVKQIAPFSVKGVLWYQGESDDVHADIYDEAFKALIACFRETFRDELPFLFVQLAPFEKWLACEGANYPIIRDKQEQVSKEVALAAMVSIMDLGMREDIHPKRKMEVGRRLAQLARGKVYGENILCESPEFKSAVRNGNEIILSFDHAGNRLYMKGESIQALTILQNDEVREIETHVIGTSIKLTIKDMTTEPVLILFAKTPYCEVNLFNEESLPVKPFSCEV